MISLPAFRTVAEHPVRGRAAVPKLTDYLVATGADGDADGDVTLEFGPVPAGHLWKVQRLVVFADSTAYSTCLVYVGKPTASNLVDGTDNGNLAVADMSQPIVVPEGQTLTVVWTGLTAGSSCTARCQYELSELINVEV